MSSSLISVYSLLWLCSMYLFLYTRGGPTFVTTYKPSPGSGAIETMYYIYNLNLDYLLNELLQTKLFEVVTIGDIMCKRPSLLSW